MKAICTVLFLLLSQGVLAAEKEAAVFSPNILRGNLSVGGAASVSRNWFGRTEDSTTASLFLPIEYFVLDHLSVGAQFSYFHWASASYSATNSFSIGPAATWYFWREDRLAASTGVVFGVDHTEGSGESANLLGRVGIGYFVTPSVSVGPYLAYAHRFGWSGRESFQSIALVGTFNIYF